MLTVIISTNEKTKNNGCALVSTVQSPFTINFTVKHKERRHSASKMVPLLTPENKIRYPANT